MHQFLPHSFVVISCSFIVLQYDHGLAWVVPHDMKTVSLTMS